MSVIDDATVDRVLERLAGGETLSAVCREAAMPNRTAFLRLVAENTPLRDRYARAREQGYYARADKMAEIAAGTLDNRRSATIEDITRDAALIQRDRLLLENEKWLLGRLHPHVFGDKQRLEHTGENGAPIGVVVQYELPANVRDPDPRDSARHRGPEGAG